MFRIRTLFSVNSFQRSIHKDGDKKSQLAETIELIICRHSPKPILVSFVVDLQVSYPTIVIVTGHCSRNGHVFSGFVEQILCLVRMFSKKKFGFDILSW